MIENSKYSADRKFVSRLIYLVLTDKLSVREAILKFPQKTKDKSIKTAYRAIIHREADEDLRARDIDYKEEQDDYLEFLAETLKKGNSIPKNIIKEYEDFYDNQEELNLPHSDKIDGMLKKLCKFLNV